MDSYRCARSYDQWNQPSYSYVRCYYQNLRTEAACSSAHLGKWSRCLCPFTTLLENSIDALLPLILKRRLSLVTERSQRPVCSFSFRTFSSAFKDCLINITNRTFITSNLTILLDSIFNQLKFYDIVWYVWNHTYGKSWS